MIILGDCLEELKKLEENSVDSIVTDPPYELGFMGKSWDNTGIANNPLMWAECLRVLKPGGYLLSFGGTRTYHRMAVAIEDAGFEVRDMIEWVYGSGFPKSLSIGKAVDKLQGNEREVVGMNRAGKNALGQDSGWNAHENKTEFETTKGTSEWEGWGTALKPSHETVCVAQKRLDSRSDIDYTRGICQTLFVEIALKSSELNLNEKTRLAIVRWTAEKNINTLEDLSEAMDILPSKSEASLSLSIVLSWLNILGEIWGAMSMFTTETKGSLTTELKILQSLEWENIFQNITLVKNNKTDGLSVDVLNVENLLNAVKLKLKYILTHSAQENAISQGNKLTFAPNHEPICMARKPLAEKTVAENVLKYGTGGINIDDSRVGTEVLENGYCAKKQGYMSDEHGASGGAFSKDGMNIAVGRFPANLIHDNSEEVRECFPDSKGNGATGGGEGGIWTTGNKQQVSPGYVDSGNASRFFKSIPDDKKSMWFNHGEADGTGVPQGPTYNDNGNASRFFKSIEQDKKVRGKTSVVCNFCGVDFDKKNSQLFTERHFCSRKCFGEWQSKFLLGENSYNWKDGKMDLISRVRSLKKMIDWRNEVYKRDNYTCKKCGDNTGGNLQAHHIHHLSDLIRELNLIDITDAIESDKLWDITNGTTLCDSCHTGTHKSLIYQAKASKSERNKGCEGLEEKERIDYGGFHSEKGLIENNRNPENRKPTTNNHPTVKPIALMEYLIKMVTPKGGTVLDPFAGSGSTLVAARQNGFKYIGIEREAEYVKIAEARLQIIQEKLI